MTLTSTKFFTFNHMNFFNLRRGWKNREKRPFTPHFWQLKLLEFFSNLEEKFNLKVVSLQRGC